MTLNKKALALITCNELNWEMRRRKGLASYNCFIDVMRDFGSGKNNACDNKIP
jgi:hypothetical protein